jgi:uncharacterized protein (TIGR03435 family)
MRQLVDEAKPTKAGNQRTRRRWRCAIGPILLLLAGVTITRGQTSVAARAAFEAASVRPYDSASAVRFFTLQGGPGTSDPGRFSCRKCTLRNLLTTAYAIKGYQLSGATASERYDVEAKVPEGTSRAQFLLMLQNLLAERFQLIFHHQLKEMTTYRLMIGKNGPKLTRSAVAGSIPDDAAGSLLPHKTDKDGFPDLPPGSGIYIYADVTNIYRLGAKNVSMQQFVETLSSSLSSPVYDATGLEGEYDFKLLWAPDLSGVVRRQDGSVVPSEPALSPAPHFRRLFRHSDSSWNHPAGR